jgi:16S rRNA (adenine(1408)-N(1))-methyltransferase
MTLTRIVGKGRTQAMMRGELDELRARATRTVVDVGTGDGKLAYALATDHPDWVVIGVDALDEPMQDTARKALRKPARGGRANLVLLRASIEALPPELAGAADEVVVMLPWGRLLEGIVLADAAVVGGIAALGAGAARLVVTLNGEIWADSTPAKFEYLPIPTPEYVGDVIAPAFAAVGYAVSRAYWLGAEEAHGIHSTWARKLGHGRAHPRFLRFEGARNT